VHAPLAVAIAVAIVALVAPAGPMPRPALAAPLPPALAEPADRADLTLPAAEASLVEMINADRAAIGLPALRLDARLTAVARERSTFMAATRTLSHTQADGRTMIDLIKANGIRWYAAGETIGWNNYPSLRDSTRAVNLGWLSSPEHAAIIRSTAYNYFGVSLAVTADGDCYWTAIFIRGPDRTPPTARMLAPIAGGLRILASGRHVRQVTWTWTGADRPLAVLTSGLQSFEVQRRIDGGAWVTVWTSTTGLRWSSSVSVGHRSQVRVRARDHAGNVGTWSAPVGLSA
jgi:uncharacterized protein YkwD